MIALPPAPNVKAAVSIVLHNALLRLTEEQRGIEETAQRFAREKLAPRYQAREQEARIDRALVRQMGALGLIGADLPEDYGGLGQPSVTAGVIIEAIAYGDFNVSYVQLLGSLQGQILARHAAPELTRHWISRIVAGEAPWHGEALHRAPRSPARCERCPVRRAPRSSR